MVFTNIILLQVRLQKFWWMALPKMKNPRLKVSIHNLKYVNFDTIMYLTYHILLKYACYNPVYSPSLSVYQFVITIKKLNFNDFSIQFKFLVLQQLFLIKNYSS